MNLNLESVRSKIRTIPGFPKPGVQFRDITTLLRDPAGLREAVETIADRFAHTPVDFVAGLEARGFILGGAVACRLGKGFVPVRKRGKLPGKTARHEYALEYGTDCVEMHVDALTPGARVLVVDDLLATGGTALAAIALIEKLGSKIAAAAFVVDLPDLGGSHKITQAGYDLLALCSFSGD